MADFPELSPLGNAGGMPLWIGMDVGGTKIEGVAADGQGRVVGRALIPTDAESAESSVGSIVRALKAVLNAAGVDPTCAGQSVAAVGLGIPGMVEEGVVSHAVNLRLDSYPLARVLSERFGVPVWIENDVRGAALGAYEWIRERREARSMVYLSIGTGISAGVILDGRLHRGKTGMAGEIGHAVLDPDGARCKCGMTGCFETVAAGPAIARQAREALAEAARTGELSLLAGVDGLAAGQVFAAAVEGDALARRVVDRAARFTALAVYNLFMNYDVELVALGGGVSYAGSAFFDPVSRALAQMALESPLAEEMLRGRDGREKVVLLPKEADATWRGMILFARQRMNAG